MIWGYPFFWKPPFRPRNHEFSVRGSILKHVLSVSNLSPRAHSGARWASGSLALLVTWHGAVTMKFSPIGRVSQRRFVYFQLTRPTRPDSLQNVVKQKVLSLSITIPLFYPFSLFNWLQRSRNGMFTPLKRLVYSMLPTRSPRSPVSCSASGAKKNRTTAAADGPGLRPIPTWGNNHFCDRKNEIWKWGCVFFSNQDMMMHMYQHIWECNGKIMRHTMNGAGSISEGWSCMKTKVAVHRAFTFWVV